MVKVVQISDLHWRGIARHEEYTAAFEELFRILREIKPDLIINTGDTWHTKTQNITPEAVDKLAWMFNGLADIAPTINILGNHDGVLSNLGRQDAISPIISAIDRKDLFLYKESVSVTAKECPQIPDNFVFHVYSPFDEEGWERLSPQPGKVNIALFHGSITGCETDMDWRMSSGERDVKFFTGMNYVMLGDIHKQQFLGYRNDKNQVAKPWIGYPGSLIQQNYGELEKKGFYLWEIEDIHSWDVSFIEVANNKPFVTVPWCGTVEKTILSIHNTRLDRAFVPGTRFRITSNEPLQPLEARQLIAELREHRGASEVVFKHLKSFQVESIEDTSGRKIAKSDLRNSPEFLFELYMDYNISNGSETVTNFNEQQLELSKKLLKDYLHKLNSELATVDCIVRNVKWSIKSLEFSNLFRYGENNSINFSELNGLVGMFGRNRIGKSSAIGAMMYALYNTTDRGPIKGAHIINKNKNFCSAKMVINIDGIDYVIVRETTRSNPKKSTSKVVDDKTTTTLQFYKIDKETGSLLEMNSISRDDTDKEIRRLIGNPGDFLLTALSSQGGVNKFIEEGSTQRKSILSRFLDLDIFEKLYGYAKEDYGILNQKTRKYIDVDWTSTTDRLQKEIGTIELEVEAFEIKLQENDAEIRIVQEWLSKNEKNPEQAREMTIEYNRLNKQHNEYLESVKDLERKIIEFKQKAVTLQTQYDTTHKELFELPAFESISFELECFEAMGEKLQELREKMAMESATYEGQKKAVHKLSVVPCGDAFPTCQYIKDGHESKALIDAQKKIVDQISSTYKEMDASYKAMADKRLRVLLEKSQKLTFAQSMAEKELSRVQDSIEQKEQTLKHMRENVLTISDKMKELQKNLMVANASEVDQKKGTLSLLQNNKFVLDNSKKDMLVKLGAAQQQLLSITKERAECKADLEKLKLYETFASAFSKTGIPAMILKTQLPAINAEIAKILGGVVDFKIELEADINSNSMDVYIEDANSKRLIELASGMEKMISSLAIRIALINVSNLPRSDMFILDEGLGVLDQEGLQKCAELFNQIKTYFKTILIITHVDQIKEVVDKLLDIEDNGFESKIVV